jgi:hypothetical protein
VLHSIGLSFIKVLDDGNDGMVAWIWVSQVANNSWKVECQGAGQLNNDTRIDRSRGVLTRAMKSLLFDAMEGEIGESGEFNAS